MGKQKSTALMHDLMELYADLLVPFMNVERDVPYIGQPSRSETDGEHTFTLAMLAITINEQLGFGLDDGLISRYALVHDLVEAHAGDVSIRASDAELAKKADTEHEAYLIIQKQFAKKAAWIPTLIHSYEARTDREACFVYAVDKMVVGLARMVGNGARWMEYYPEPDGSLYHRVVALLRQKVEVFPELLELFDVIHDELDRRRVEYLKRDSNQQSKA